MFNAIEIDNILSCVVVGLIYLFSFDGILGSACEEAS